jgi:hypothetical protein
LAKSPVVLDRSASDDKLTMLVKKALLAGLGKFKSFQNLYRGPAASPQGVKKVNKEQFKNNYGKIHNAELV